MEVTEWPLLDEVYRLWGGRTPISRAEFDLLPEWARGRAFTAARIAGEHALRDLQDSVGRALFSGQTLREWLSGDYERIAARYGRPGATRAAYEDMLFRTNQQAAVMAGRYTETFSPEWMEMAPYWQYLAIDDGRTRAEHRALDGKVFRKDDPMARRYLPPTGFNCRCTVLELTAEDVRAERLDVMNGAGIPFLEHEGRPIGPPPPGWNTDRVAALVPEFMDRNPQPSREEVLGRVADEIRGLDREVGAAVHQDGRVLFVVRGDVDRIELTPAQATQMRDAVFVHNHPRGLPPSFPTGTTRASIGLTGDIGVAVDVDAAGVHVAAIVDGVQVNYSVMRPNGGWDKKKLQDALWGAGLKHYLSPGLSLEKRRARMQIILKSVHDAGEIIYGKSG